MIRRWSPIFSLFAVLFYGTGAAQVLHLILQHAPDADCCTAHCHAVQRLIECDRPADHVEHGSHDQGAGPASSNDDCPKPAHADAGDCATCQMLASAGAWLDSAPALCLLDAAPSLIIDLPADEPALQRWFRDHEARGPPRA